MNVIEKGERIQAITVGILELNEKLEDAIIREERDRNRKAVLSNERSELLFELQRIADSIAREREYVESE